MQKKLTYIPVHRSQNEDITVQNLTTIDPTRKEGMYQTLCRIDMVKENNASNMSRNCSAVLRPRLALRYDANAQEDNMHLKNLEYAQGHQRDKAMPCTE